jgi:hypothetical protein
MVSGGGETVELVVQALAVVVSVGVGLLMARGLVAGLLRLTFGRSA